MSVERLYRAGVNVEDLGFTPSITSCNTVVGEECHLHRQRDQNTKITHVYTDPVYTNITDAQAAEDRLQTYVDLCIAANDWRKCNG